MIDAIKKIRLKSQFILKLYFELIFLLQCSWFSHFSVFVTKIIVELPSEEIFLTTNIWFKFSSDGNSTRAQIKGKKCMVQLACSCPPSNPKIKHYKTLQKNRLQKFLYLLSFYYLNSLS